MRKKTLKAFLFCCFMTFSIVVVGYHFLDDSLEATIVIFVVSLVFFHVVLFRFKKHENIWKSTDYLFEVVAILSIIAAVSGLNDASKQKYLQEQFAKRKLAQVEFIYAAETVVTNDCDPLKSRADIWEVSPEPNFGECDRLKHMIPQMRFDFDRETGPENMTSDTVWADNFEYKGQKLEGTWEYVQDKAEEFITISKENEKAISQREDARGMQGFDISRIDSVFYWHHVLAFLLALKISRISMEIFKKNGTIV
ncbi:hypothetical protein MN202_02725 [Rheinheimera muenzenbergensis]|uniref:Uncharacterized protein n=1 Tax=Rheinheimera muenzenbergensis TaxID=1193628 RepID=A0ABU8C2M4_9GAMM